MLACVERWCRRLGGEGSPLHVDLPLLAWKIMASQAGASLERLNPPTHTALVAVYSRDRPVRGEKVALSYAAPPVDVPLKLQARAGRDEQASIRVPHLARIQARALGVEESIIVDGDSRLEIRSGSMLRHALLVLRGRV